MFGYIYVTKNLITGTRYIGKHVSATFDDTYLGSGVELQKAIKEYGKDAFECHILDSDGIVPTICKNLEELNSSEYYYINLYNCVLSENFYNLKSGGDGFNGGPVAESTKKKISAYNLNKILIHKDDIAIKIDRADLDTYLSLGWAPGPLPFCRSKAFKEKVSATITGQIGMHKGNKKIKVKPEFVDSFLKDGFELGWGTKKQYVQKTIPGTGAKKYMHKDNIFKLVYESNWEAFLADGWVFGGKKRPVVHRKRGYHLSEAHIEKLKKAHLGHKQTAEAIKKQADKLRGKIYVHKNGISKLIAKDELDTFLALGWFKGRATKEEYSKAKEKGLSSEEAINKVIENHSELPKEAIIKTVETGCDLEF